MNAVELIAMRLEDIDPGADGIRVYKRRLIQEDDTESIGVSAALWNPDRESLEMRGGPIEPTIQRYTIMVQGLVKDMDETRGIAVHSLLAHRIRSMLYRDVPLALGFAELSVTFDGVEEKAAKWGVNSQGYLNNEIKGSFVFLSSLEFYLETQIN